jgi:hypothetical protein
MAANVMDATEKAGHTPAAMLDGNRRHLGCLRPDRLFIDLYAEHTEVGAFTWVHISG